METNKKEKKGECLGRELGALIKFGRENGSGPKVWITFLFDELSRLTTGNGDIKSIADKKLKIFTSPCACCSIALDCLRKAHFRRLRLAGPGSSPPYWLNAKEMTQVMIGP